MLFETKHINIWEYIPNIVVFFSEHQNYFGVDDNLGPVAISIKREKLDERENRLGKSEPGLYQYRVILRTSEVSFVETMLSEHCIVWYDKHLILSVSAFQTKMTLCCDQHMVIMQKTFSAMMAKWFERFKFKSPVALMFGPYNSIVEAKWPWHFHIAPDRTKLCFQPL